MMRSVVLALLARRAGGVGMSAKLRARCGTLEPAAECVAVHDRVLASVAAEHRSAVRRLLHFGGYACYALTLLATPGGVGGGWARTAEQASLARLCGDGGDRTRAAIGRGGDGRVVVQLHNGLGNQIFQHLFGALLARDLGLTLAHTTTPFAPAEPLATHTELGFAAFGALFNSSGARLPDACAGARGAVLDARPKTVREAPLAAQLGAALAHLADVAAPPCLRVVGFFQDFALYSHVARGGAAAVRAALAHAAPEPAVRPSAADAVVHLRWCNERDAARRTRQVEFYDHALERVGARRVKVLTTCTGGFFLAHLLSDLKAEIAGRGAHGDAVVRGRQDAAVSSVLDDHAYMTRARYLIIDQASTFAFWAACFSDAEQVHLPTPGMPLVTWAKSSLTRNFTFHSLV